MDEKIQEYWSLKVANSKGILSESPYSDKKEELLNYQASLLKELRSEALKLDIDLSKKIYGKLVKIDDSRLSILTKLELLYEMNTSASDKLEELTSIGKFYGIWSFPELRKALGDIEREFKALSKKYNGDGMIDSIISNIDSCSKFLRKLGTFPKGGGSK